MTPLQKSAVGLSLIIVAASGLVGCATAPSHFYNRSGGTSEDLLKDIKTCGDISQDIHARARYIWTDPKGGAAAAGGAAFGAGFAAGMQEAKLQQEAIDNCLKEKGWAAIPLTDAEKKEFSDRGSVEARRAYLKTWMERHPYTADAKPN
jgi:hypothetical protein